MIKAKDLYAGLQRVKPFIDKRSTDAIRETVLLTHTGPNITITSDGEYGRLETTVPAPTQPHFDTVAVPWEALAKTVKALLDGGDSDITIKAQDEYASPWDTVLPEVQQGDRDTSKCIGWLEAHDADNPILASYDAMLARARRVVRQIDPLVTRVADLSWEACESICLRNDAELPDGFVELAYAIRNEVIEVMQAADDIRHPTTSVTIEAGDSAVDLGTEPATDFPKSHLADIDPEDTGILVGQFDVHRIDAIKSRLLPHTSPANSGRPILTGVSWNPKDDRIEIAAANGYHLGVLSIAYTPKSDIPPAFILPGDTIKRIKTGGVGRLTQNKHEVFDLMYYPQSNIAVMTFASGARLEIPCIDGRFPDYKHIIPVSPVGNIRVKAADVIGGLNLAERFAGSGRPVRLLPDPDAGILAISSQDASGTAVKHIKAAFKTADPAYIWPTIALGCEKIQAVVQAVTWIANRRQAEEIDIECSGRTADPLILSPVGDDSYLAVLMPMNPDN